MAVTSSMTGYPLWLSKTNINDYSSGTNANPVVEVTTYTNVPSGTSGVSVWERRVRDGRGLTVVTDEDVVGRVATVGFPTIYQGAATLRTSRTNRFTYTVAGMIDHVDTVDSGGTLRTTYYKYDDARRRRQADSPEGVLTWQRDAQGNIIAMQGYRRSAVTANAEVTGGTTTDVDVAYGYDAMNRLSSVTDRKVSTTRSLGYAFDAAGRVQTATYPNGATNRFTYDVRHRLLKTDWWQTNGTLMRAYNDTLSSGGVRVAVTESDPANSSRRSISWQYDLNGTNQLARLYRLTSETITNLGSLGTEQHAYDLVGNRLSRSVTGFITSSLPSSSTWTDNARDELNVDTYDGAGNTTLGTSLSLANTDSYDAENHLILRGTNTAPAVQIDYDAFGNRVKKTAGGATIWYLVDDQSPSGYQQVVAEFNSLSSAPLRTYAYGLSLIDIVGSGTTSYALTDGQGSVRALFSDNAAASLTDSYDFDAYGVLTASSGSTVNNYRYTSQQWDPDLQLYYLRARYYAPTLGRFWSSDSYVGSQSEPASLHKYLYCRADPVDGTDPSGYDDLGSLISSTAIQGHIQGFRAGAVLVAKRVALNTLYGAIIGGASGEWDSILGGGDPWQGLLNGVRGGALFGGAGSFPALQPLLQIVGIGLGAGATIEAASNGHYAQAGYRGILTALGVFVAAKYEGGGTAENPGPMSNAQVRQWYHEQLAKIPSQVDQGADWQTKAMQAYCARVIAKIRARALMANQNEADELPDPQTLSSLIEEARGKKGLSGDAIWQSIYESSTHSNPDVDKKYGGN